MSRRRRVALDAVLKKREQGLQARRKRSALHRRVWRRYLRQPFWDLKTSLFAHRTVGADETSVPSLDEVLNTIRRAWESPRCLASDREAGACEEQSTLVDTGTDREMSSKLWGQIPTNPGLPHRRYSVPETIMRKYSLSKQQSGSSDSGVATVPVATPDTISSNTTDKPGSSSDDPTAETSSSHSSDHNSDKMGNAAVKGTCSPVLSESATNNAPTKSTLDTVSEQSSKSVPGSATEDTVEAPYSTQTSPEASSSTTRNHTSPEDITGCAEPKISAWDDLLAMPPVLGDNKPPSTPSIGVESSPPNSTECTEPQSSVKDDLSPSQTPGLESTDSGPSSTVKQEAYQSPESVDQQSDLQDEMSFTRTKVAESNDYTSQSMHNKESIGSSDGEANGEEETNISRQDNSAHSEHAGSIHSSADERVEHQSPSMVKSSSSQMMEVKSIESKPPTTSDTISATPGRSSRNRISMPEVCSQTSTVSPDQPPLLRDTTQCSTLGEEASVTPTERCVTTPDPERPHSLSSMSHQASESCSITPVESSVSGSSPERPSVTMSSLISSATPPSSDHTVSTQDATLSLRSDSTVLSTPSSVIRGCNTPIAHPGQTQVSNSEKSIDHIDFMNESVDSDNRPILNMLGRHVKTQSVESNSQKTESRHATKPDCTLGEAKNNSKERGEAEPPAGSSQVSHKQASTNTEFEHCRTQSKSLEIIIQPTVVQRDMSKCLDNDTACKTKIELPGNKMSVLPSKKQDMEFCGSKTYLLMKPISSTTVQTHNAEFCGTATYPPTKSRFSPGIQAVPSSSTASLYRSEDMGLYGWSRLTDEEHAVQLQLQRQRLWMNRRISASNALPTSPMHGPIGSCVGTGSTYRKGYDTQLVVPRYSALPRSISMLVNTSSGECSSNSNSDSDCLSLVDSLEERPSSCTSKHNSTKHDSKPVRGDILQLLPEDRNYKHGLHRRINAATPRGKGKAFFVSMETGLDEAGTVKILEDIEKQVVSQSMPDRLKKKLSQRYQQIDLKKNKKKGLKNQGEDVVMNTEQKENIRAEVETSGAVVVQAMNNIQSMEDKNALREMSQTENKPHEKVKTTDPSVSIKTIHKKSPAGLPPSMKSSAGIFQPLSQSKSGERTFILSRNDSQEKNEWKLPEKSIPVEVLSKFPSVDDMIKKEHILQEHSPPVKRFKASRHDFPPQEGQQTPKKEEVNISQNGMTTCKEVKREEQSPLPKTSNSINDFAAEHRERKSPAQESAVKSADSARNGAKEQGVHKQEEECTLNVPKEVQEEVKPMKKGMSQEISNVPVEENMTAKEQKTEEGRPPVKTANGSNRKMQKGDKSAKEGETKKNSRNETHSTKYEDQSLPVKTSINETNNKKENKIINERKLLENGEGFAKDSPSPETRESIPKPDMKLESKKPKVPQKQLENCENLLQHNIKEQMTANRDDLKNNINTTEAQQVKAATAPLAERKDTKSSVAETPPEEKSLITVSCQTSPELKCEEEKSSATPNTNPQSNIQESPPDPIKNRPQLLLKSAIPIMKSPIGTRKLSPDTAITFQQSLQNSHLPVHRQSQLLRAPQIRRSANLLGAKFHQRFEVIPEERSGSLESSAEDQLRPTIDRSPRSSLSAGQTGTKVSIGSCLGGRSNIVSHSCLDLNQANKHKQNRQSASNSESSTSNHEESNNGNVRATNSNIRRKATRRPIRQSRIPMAEKITRQTRMPEDSMCEEQEEKNYQGKAALAPHTEDKDLLILSKGWLNFYLLKGSCGTPDSSCGEAQTDVPEREKGISRKKGTVFPRTVTVVGGDDNRIRQYTVPSRLLQQDRNKDKQASTILPELTSNHNMRRTSAASVQKLPVTLLKPNDSSAGSDNSTTYLCLPSPRLNANYLLEGSGELACSESSVPSSSDSECDRATSPAMLPIRLPTRQPQRGSTHHWSRFRKKHYKSEQFQSHSQSAGGGSAGWTVTVAGSNACPQQPPELEMRLSFPSCARRPGASQSDSGLGEDNNNGEKSKKQEQKDDDHFLPPAQSAPQTHKWTLMVKNQGGSERSHDTSKSAKRTSQYLPDLGHNPGQSKNSKKVLKRPDSCFPVTSIADEDTRKSKNFSLLWPKVKKIMESKVIIRKSSGHVSQEVKSISELLDNEDGATVLRSGLGIKGSAITPEKKPKVPTMSERDLTRSHTARH